MGDITGIPPRSRIMQAGGELFAETSYDEVTVRQICQRANLANGSFFHVFASKQALAAELYLQACRKRDALVERMLARAVAKYPDDAAVAIKFVVKILVTFLGSPTTEPRLLRRLREAVRHDPVVQPDPDGLAGFSAVVERCLEQSPAAGQVAVQPPLLALLLLAPARAYADLLMDGQTAPAEETINQLADRVWAAVRAETAVPPPSKQQQQQRRRPARTATTNELDLLSLLDEIQNKENNEAPHIK
jgi:AcrR family transcriptional regulator